ncbi:MAG: hypothetical protein GXO40_06205 [Epsilonproteobacteria bacterium]|nr:hypothetical protein [Campylobacterota bacterium]
MNFLYNKDYRTLVNKQSKQQLLYLIKHSIDFSVVVNMDEGITFSPQLPDEIMSGFKDIVIFAIAGYTLGSAFVENDILVFEAGFGRDNFGSIVKVDIDRIMQILVQDNPIFINLTATLPKQTSKDSLDVFIKNPKNKKFFK